jgi:hypothetical protein
LLLVIIVSAPFFCQYGFMVKLVGFDYFRTIPFGKRRSGGDAPAWERVENHPCRDPAGSCIIDGFGEKNCKMRGGECTAARWRVPMLAGSENYNPEARGDFAEKRAFFAHRAQSSPNI